jgi:hypothetical protein
VAQSLVVYLAVAGAAAWVVWSILLPRSVRGGLKRRLSPRRAPAGGKDDDCGCGGGCSH